MHVTPAARWNEADKRGALREGMDAHIVVLDADPAMDARNFARVRRTSRAGRVMYASAQ